MQFLGEKSSWVWTLNIGVYVYRLDEIFTLKHRMNKIKAL